MSGLLTIGNLWATSYIGALPAVVGVYEPPFYIFHNAPENLMQHCCGRFGKFKVGPRAGASTSRPCQQLCEVSGPDTRPGKQATGESLGCELTCLAATAEHM